LSVVGILSISFSSSMMLLMRLESFGIAISVQVSLIGLHESGDISVVGVVGDVVSFNSVTDAVVWFVAVVVVVPQETVVLCLAFLEPLFVIVVYPSL